MPLALNTFSYWAKVKFLNSSGRPYAFRKEISTIMTRGTMTIMISVKIARMNSGILAPRSLISVGRMDLPLMMS